MGGGLVTKVREGKSHGDLEVTCSVTSCILVFLFLHEVQGKDLTFERKQEWGIWGFTRKFGSGE